MSALLAGHMPWLPPTPKPTSTLKLSDERGQLAPPADPEMAAKKGASTGMQRPWRKCVAFKYALKSAREMPSGSRGQNANYTTYVYELECGHEALRRMRCTATTCGMCPRERCDNAPRGPHLPRLRHHPRRPADRWGRR